MTKPGTPTEIDLDLAGMTGQRSIEQLNVDKPNVSNKVWKRRSSKHKIRVSNESDHIEGTH